jgi:hypothetical protein
MTKPKPKPIDLAPKTVKPYQVPEFEFKELCAIHWAVTSVGWTPDRFYTEFVEIRKKLDEMFGEDREHLRQPKHDSSGGGVP